MLYDAIKYGFLAAAIIFIIFAIVKKGNDKK